MSELGSSAAVPIESVEWLDAGGGNLTVRVSGRWRRRRGWGGAEFRTPAVLVVEAEGRRHRFPAMPDPPSLAGAAPGTWRLSFSVPGELAPQLGGHAYLTLGTVTVPLPVPESAASPAVASPPATSPAVASPPAASPAAHPSTPSPSAGSHDVPAPASEDAATLEIERAWRRADAAERTTADLGDRLGELERTLAEERRDRDRSLQERDRRRRTAEQRAHAEEALRHDLEHRLAVGARETERARRALGELAGAEERIRELESSLQHARRAGDEAQRAAAAARAARERAERRLVTSPAAAPSAETERLAAEASLRLQRHHDHLRIPAEPSGGIARPVMTVVDEHVPHADLVTALRRELAVRVSAEAGLRARLVQAETGLAARVLLAQRTQVALRDLRAELEQLREIVQRERAARRAAEAETARIRAELGGRRPQEVSAEIAQIRSALEDLRDPQRPREGVTPGAVTPAAVTPERLSDALARLREAQAPREPAPAAEAAEPAEAEAASSAAAQRSGGPPVSPAPRVPGGPTVERAVRRLAAADPERAGRLLLDLLGAQRVAHPHPIAYDLVLGPGRGCVQVTVGPDDVAVALAGAARAREQVDLQIVGDPARLTRRLLAGRLRRLLRVGLARVRGDRGGLAAVRALLALPLDLVALSEAGLRVEPESLLTLVAGMTDPGWTRGTRFTVACVDDRGATAHLQIRDGAAPLVTREAPEGWISVTVRGTGAQLVRTLTESADVAEVSGDEGALIALREWIDRAQSG